MRTTTKTSSRPLLLLFLFILVMAGVLFRNFLTGKAFDKIKQTTAVSLLLLLRPTS